MPSLHSSTSHTDSDAEPASKRDCTRTAARKAHVKKSHTARLRRKRNLNKLAWQVAEHLRKAPEKWLKLVEA